MLGKLVRHLPNGTWMKFISSETTITLVHLGYINLMGARQVLYMYLYSLLMKALKLKAQTAAIQ